MKRIALALALLLAPAAASAQCNGTFPNNTICGNVTGSANLPRPTSPSAFLGAAGGTNGQQQYNNGGALAGFTQSGDVTVNTSTGVSTIQPNAVTTGKVLDGAITNPKLTPGAANTVKGSLNGTTTSDLAIASCSVAYRFTQWVTGTGWQCGISPVLPSRAVALTLDLSAFSAITTQGYTLPGDGGGATYQKIAGNFVDTRITGGAITNNGTSGCTNGTYYTLPFNGGNGRGELGGTTGVITVAGNVVTSIANVGGYNGAMAVGYTAGDVLSVTVPGCATTVTWTVSSVSTPTGSFADAAANKWQPNFPAEGLDARVMGVKFDWDGTDGTATDNYTTLQNALSFAWFKTNTSIDVGGTQGGTVLLTKQTAMIGCSASNPIVTPYGVKVKGQGNYATAIKMCNSFPTSANQWELCNSFSRLACFGALLEDFQIFNQFDIVGSSGRSVVYTNNAQHEAGLRSMAIYPGACGRGATYETGYGGATYILLVGVEFKGGKSDANCGGAGGAQVFISYGTTQVKIDDLNVSGLAASSGGPRANGLVIGGGFVTIRGVHAEQVLNPVTINIPGGVAAGMVRAMNAIGGVDCVGMFTLQNGNTFGNFMISPPMATNGCANMVVNNMAGGGGNMGAATATDVVFLSGTNKAW